MKKYNNLDLEEVIDVPEENLYGIIPDLDLAVDNLVERHRKLRATWDEILPKIKAGKVCRGKVHSLKTDIARLLWDWESLLVIISDLDSEYYSVGNALSCYSDAKKLVQDQFKVNLSKLWGA